MNKRTTYETTIADKLGQLPVPDMRDAIWSRIEDQLDIDMPGGDDDPPAPQAPRGPRGLLKSKRIGVLATVVTIVTIFFIQQRKTTTPANEYLQPIIEQKQPASFDVGNGPPPGSTGITPYDIQTANGKTGDARTDTGQYVVKDPLFPFSSPPLLLPDTPAHQQTIPPQLVDLFAKDTIPQKKPRGIKGITDDDYRISIKKDSVP